MTTKAVEFTETVLLVTLNCSECHILFALQKEMNSGLQQNHTTFYCPNGHRQYYPGKTEEARLREQLSEAHANVAHYRELFATETKAHSATKGQVTRLRKRVLAGDCSFCHRHFPNVEQHMRDEHDKVADLVPKSEA